MDVLYAELLRYYNVDLSDILASTPSISPTKVVWLIQSLPVESRTSAILRKNPESYGWTNTDYLLANVIDSVRENTFANIQVRTKKKLQPFDRTPVPGMREEKKKPTQNKFLKMAQQQWALGNKKED